MRMMLKTVAVLLLLCFGLASADSKKCDVSATEGQTIVVPLNYQGNSNNLLWKRKNETIFRKLSETSFPVGKSDDIFKNGSLKVINLDKNKSGEYVNEVYHASGEPAFTGTINVCLFDKVPNPEMKIKCSATHVTLSCKVDKDQKGLEFGWLKNGVVTKDKDSTLKIKAEDAKDDQFQCKVSNVASSQTTKALKQTCFGSKLFGLDFWIMVGILAGGGGLVVLLIIIIIVCCVRARRKKTMKSKDEEELRLEWTKSEREHHHHHHHQHQHPSAHPHPHHQCQPAGHTGPRHHRSKNKTEPPRSKLPEPPKSKPQPSPRRAAQPPVPVAPTDDEQPPPLPQPRKKIY